MIPLVLHKTFSIPNRDPHFSHERHQILKCSISTHSLLKWDYNTSPSSSHATHVVQTRQHEPCKHCHCDLLGWDFGDGKIAHIQLPIKKRCHSITHKESPTEVGRDTKVETEISSCGCCVWGSLRLCGGWGVMMARRKLQNLFEMCIVMSFVPWN